MSLLVWPLVRCVHSIVVHEYVMCMYIDMVYVHVIDNA